MDCDEEILSYYTLLGPNHKQFCQSEVNSAMSIYSNNSSSFIIYYFFYLITPHTITAQRWLRQENKCYSYKN